MKRWIRDMLKELKIADIKVGTRHRNCATRGN